jgi:hypothetical protein
LILRRAGVSRMRQVILAVVLFCAVAASATITLPPKFSCSNRTSGGGIATVTVSCTGTVVAGDLLLFGPTCQSCNTTTGLTLTPTNAGWGTLNGCTSTNNTDRWNFSTTVRVDMCWAIATSGGTNPSFKLDVTNAPASFLGMNVAVVGNSGAGGWAVDAGPGSGTCASPAATCATSNVTTGTTAIFWAVWSTDATQLCTAGTGYTTTNATTNARTCGEISTSVESGSTTRTGSITGNTSANWVGFNMSFKESGGAPPATCGQSMALMGVGCR